MSRPPSRTVRKGHPVRGSLSGASARVAGGGPAPNGPCRFEPVTVRQSSTAPVVLGTGFFETLFQQGGTQSPGGSNPNSFSVRPIRSADTTATEASRQSKQRSRPHFPGTPEHRAETISAGYATTYSPVAYASLGQQPADRSTDPRMSGCPAQQSSIRNVTRSAKVS